MWHLFSSANHYLQHMDCAVDISGSIISLYIPGGTKKGPSRKNSISQLLLVAQLTNFYTFLPIKMR